MQQLTVKPVRQLVARGSECLSFALPTNAGQEGTGKQGAPGTRRNFAVEAIFLPRLVLLGQTRKCRRIILYNLLGAFSLTPLLSAEDHMIITRGLNDGMTCQLFLCLQPDGQS